MTLTIKKFLHKITPSQGTEQKHTAHPSPLKMTPPQKDMQIRFDSFNVLNQCTFMFSDQANRCKTYDMFQHSPLAMQWLLQESSASHPSTWTHWSLSPTNLPAAKSSVKQSAFQTFLMEGASQSATHQTGKWCKGDQKLRGLLVSPDLPQSHRARPPPMWLLRLLSWYLPLRRPCSSKKKHPKVNGINGR
jgi:hypothetical protein